MFIGPSGVGKTFLAKQLSKELFGSEDSLIRLDMSEYQEAHSISKLIGAPPGYIGHEQGGRLTEAVRRQPFSVVLLDEIEKAHPDIYNAFLQVLDDGRLTDGLGRTVDFKRTIIIMTSNTGFNNSSTIGFQESDEDKKAPLRELFSPEFIDRLDEVVYFEKHDDAGMIFMINQMLEEIREELASRDILISFSEAVAGYLLDKADKKSASARSLRALLREHIEDPLSIELLMKPSEEGIIVTVDDDKLVFARPVPFL